MKVWKKFVSVFSLILCLAVFLAGNCFAADMEGGGVEPRAVPYKSLNVPTIKQKYETSCWATSGASVCGYYGYSISQEMFAQKAGLSVTDSGYFRDIKKGLSAYNIATGPEHGTVIPYLTARAEINAGRPILVNSMRHTLVLDGYDESDGVQQLTFMDPEFGTHTYTIYSYAEAGIYDEWKNPYGYGFTDYMTITR